MVIECNGGLWELSEENYHEMVRLLAHKEVVHLPELGTKIGEIKLSIGSITLAEAKRLYQQREKEKMEELCHQLGATGV